MGKTKIQWCDYSWNPLKVRSGGFGCTKVSEGCLHCYAGRMNKRLFDGHDYDYQYRPTDFYLDERILAQPLHWRKPRTIFVCSMCDLFHENVKAWEQETVIDIMAEAKQHTFLVLTKRPRQMQAMMAVYYANREIEVLPNVWLGVTAENQERANERIPILLSIPAAKHFVSVEPMLGPVWLNNEWVIKTTEPAIDWILCGCESGPGARQVDAGCVMSLKDQCVASDIPFFLKQMKVNGRLAKMPVLDGRTWSQTPLTGATRKEDKNEG